MPAYIGPNALTWNTESFCGRLFQIVGVLIIYSRIAEVNYEIKYGEKKDLSQWASRANLLDTRSGFSTPAAFRTPGTRTPNLPPE